MTYGQIGVDVVEKRAVIPNDIKNENMRSIAEYIRLHPVFTIKEAADATGISRQTVTKTIEAYLSSGTLVMSEKGESTAIGGKKPELYALNPDFCFAAVTSQRDICRYELLTLRGEVLGESESDFYDSYSLNQFADVFVSKVLQLIETAGVKEENFLGCILGLGGVIEQNLTIRYNATVRGWGRNARVVDEIQKKVPSEKAAYFTHITLDNIARICAAASLIKKSLLEQKVILGYFERGIALNIIDRGMILSGPNGVLGETGHMVIDVFDSERCGCGQYGCLEVMMSETRIKKMVNDLSKEDKEKIFSCQLEREDIRTCILRLSGQLESADGLCRYMARMVAAAFRNLMYAQEPDGFILQGFLSSADERFLEYIKDDLAGSEYLAGVPVQIELDSTPLEKLQRVGCVQIMTRKLLEERVVGKRN